MTRPSCSGYMDALGQAWAVEKLDAIFADEIAMLTVVAAAGQGLNPNGTWSPGRVWSYAKARYQREEVAALLHLLVTRYFDTTGARYLKRQGKASRLAGRGRR